MPPKSGLNPRVAGLVLAGGHARRMGVENKALVQYKGQPLYHYAVQNLRPHVGKIIISTNSQAAAFTALGYHVVDDGEFAQKGPLSGIYAALRVAECDFLAIAPCDQLHLPEHVYASLIAATDADKGAYAFDGTSHIPTCAVLPVTLCDQVYQRLSSHNLRLTAFMHDFCHRITFDQVEFSNLNELPQ